MTRKKPNFFIAILPIFITMALLIWLVVFNGGAPHVAIILGIAVTSMIAKMYGYSWIELREHMIKVGTDTLLVIGILMVIGMLIGSLIISGSVPLLMIYGLDVFHPKYFLPLTTIIASVISLATGSSWGTIGTIGIAFMGVGEGLGIPAYLSAGAIVSGAYFGDKLSPLSDTTNFCANAVGVQIPEHIKSMLPSTLPAMAIGLVIYYYLGLEFTGSSFDNAHIIQISEVIKQSFYLSPLLLIPFVLIIIASLMKLPPIPSIFIGLVAGVVLAFYTQSASIPQLLDTLMYGYKSNTGDKFVDELLSKGGLDSMMWVSGLIILTVCYGGLLEKIRTIEVLVEGIVSVVKKIGPAVLSNTVIMIVLTFTTDLYVAYTLATKIFCPIKRGWGYSTTNVSRVLESSGTMIDPLVPWSPAGVFVTSKLGVPTILYAPVSFVCWMTPIFDVLWGYTGFFMTKATKEEIQKWNDENSLIAKDGKLVHINERIMFTKKEI